MRTSRFFTPHSWQPCPAASAAICAANGVDLRGSPEAGATEVAHDRALPWRSVMVMMVLLNGRVNVGNALGDVLLYLLANFGCGLGHEIIGSGSLLRPWKSPCAVPCASGVGAGALAAHRQAATVAHAAVAAEVHQPLDVHRRLAAQVAPTVNLATSFTQTIHLPVREFL